MIKYSLHCKNCDFSFESWFASSKEYEKLKRKKLLNCHSCNSINVEKSLMAPSLINSKLDSKSTKQFKKYTKIKKTISEYQKFIKNNFEYVGNNFAYEARAIHYDNKKKDNQIYGTASIEEVNELREEGINTEMIPWIDEKNN